MKVPIDEVAVISLDAPVLSALRAREKERRPRWFGLVAGTCRDGTATGRVKAFERRTAWTAEQG